MSGVDAPYVALAAELVATGLVSDPWIEGRPRFRRAPVRVTEAELAELHAAAEAVALAYDEAARIVAREPSLLDDFFVLTPCQRAMALATAPLWHGVARADVFRTREGALKICEINSDTPTGVAEAVALDALVARSGGRGPNGELERRFVATVDALRRALVGDAAPRVAGILYPTDLPEDLALVGLYRAWLERAGYDVALGSPYNLEADADGTPSLLGAPCAVLVRHYKTDWWGERLPVFHDDEPFADPLPLAGPLAAIVGAAARGRAAVVNPLGSVVTQNKLCMALMWEHAPRFSPAAREAIEAFVPETVRLAALHPEQLSAEREDWVLKSDYGCEGDEVLVGAALSQAEWDARLASAVPERWVAQRRFVAAETEEGEAVNHGVFLLAGRATGLYARVQRGPTDRFAASAPVELAS